MTSDLKNTDGKPVVAAPTWAILRLSHPVCAAGKSTLPIVSDNQACTVGGLEDTRCASCDEVVIARYGYYIREYRLTPDGRCPSCAAVVPGRWSARFDGQIASRPFIPRGRGLELRIVNS